MELIYSVDCRGLTINRDYSYGEETAISLSCRNILAFIVSNNVESPSGFERNCDQFEVCYEVKVLDLDRPWEDHHVLFSTLPIKHLHWDPSGLKLVAVDVLGLFHVWKMEDNLINRWEKVGTAGVKGDEVLAVAWLQDSLQTYFNPEKRDSVFYVDKFQRGPLPSTPSLLNSKSQEGWVAITASGMVIVGILNETSSGEDRALITAQQSLGATYQQITRADVSFTPDGQVMVVVNDGSVAAAVQCYLLTVTVVPSSVQVSVQGTSSFHFKGQMDFAQNKDSQALRVHQVQFLNSVTSDVVLVVGGGQGYSCLEVWQLVETTVPLHRMFQAQGQPDPSNKVRRWVHKMSISHNSQVASMACPRLPMVRTLSDMSGFQSYIALSYRDGSIKILHRQSFQVLWTSGVDGVLAQKSPSSRGEKRRRTTPYLSCLQQTAAGCGLIGQCAGHLYLFRVFNVRDSPLQIAPPVIIMLFEYFMFVGHDFWDVLLAIRQGMIEAIITRLMDNFNKQPHSLQEMLRPRLLRIKMALYMSLGTGGQSKAADMWALLTLNSIFSLFKSILRPRAITAQEKGPAEKLSMLVLKQAEPDLDGTIASLEADEFLFEAIRKDKSSFSDNSLPALQPYLQWVGDFALHLLTSVPQCQGFGGGFLGALLLRDPTVLTQLRELLIITRIWGLVNGSCLPVFNANATFHDCLAHLYRLVTKLWVNLKDGVALESDDALVDECIHLSSMAQVPDHKQSFGEETSSFAILWLSLPQTFSLGVVPDFLYSLMTSRRLFNFEGHFFPRQHYDIIRHIHLGAKQSDDVRECTRCTARSLLRSTARTPLALSWEARYRKNCVCGGLWKLRRVH